MTDTTTLETLQDTEWEEADEQTQARVRALCVYLETDPGSITEGYSKTVFRFNPHTVRDGTGIRKAQALVATLRNAMRKADIPIGKRDDMVTDETRKAALSSAHIATCNAEPGQEEAARKESIEAQALVAYGTIAKHLRECNPESLKIGIHDVLNTLYFVSPETDGKTHAEEHRDTIREAFDGVTVKDRTKPRETQDGEYSVLDDVEADSAWDDYLESCLDDGGIVEGADSPYFDREAWKHDARTDGRGHSLGGYDGCEHYADDPETETAYYIYRTN